MRIIGHLDMDAFFAAVEERDNPRFRGRPIVVGADPKGGAGRGVVSTANYAAREYGIRSALPISTAWRLAESARRKGRPAAVFLDVDMQRYAAASGAVMAILRGHADQVEEASVDEAYFDLSFTGSYKKARTLCAQIKKEIRAKERLTASIGIGPNKLVAKMASDSQKPDGLTVISEDQAEAFLEPLPIRALPGIGPKTEERLNALGIRTVRQLKKLSLEELVSMSGKWGRGLYEHSRGRDGSQLETAWEEKSIGEQETFEEDTRDPIILQTKLQELARGVHRRLQKSGFDGFRTVVVTVRFADFTTRNRSSTSKTPGDRLDQLEFEALRLFMPFLDARENPKRRAIRLLGVRVEKLS